MKKTGKLTFFIVVALIALFSLSAIVGLDYRYGDNTKTMIKGIDDIRLGIDIKGGVDATFAPAGDFDASDDQLDAATEVIKTRLSSLGITDSEVYSDSKSDRIIVRFPWQAGETNFDPESAVRELGEMAELTFRMGTESTTDATGKSAYTGEIVLQGADVESASVRSHQNEQTMEQEIVVALDLKDTGVQKFADATQQAMNANVPIAIWMDDEQISAPSVNTVITDGSAVITGNFTYETAKKLADQINGGALPFKMETKSTNTISPTMGEGSLDAIMLAAAIAFAFIAIYMIVLYRLPGVVAVIALIGQITGSIAFVTGWFGFMSGSTLTIPGIAGIILAVGMGVDANIITGERIKEELRTGKSLDASIKLAYKRAFSAILDGNLTNVIIAVILMGAFGVPSSFFSKILNKTIFFAFGATAEGFVYSFGFTLLAGVILNFVMGVFAARLMVTSLSKFNCFKNRKLYGGDVK
ncbi:MAG: SecD/SecF family protein translocase subunit [Ruminococcus flavefaciens]|nr:SecD/SecF family protein translocase subunit [Ruminococcus flavefaciens]MCM1360473.1 SecD/SecF family protein translocase subunit [Clostridiales bacterium]MCM1435809.1 SecD/SecF family protein translocase subunit [Ruminococcus flavefaciens]